MKPSVFGNPFLFAAAAISLFVLFSCDISERESIEIIHPPTIQDSIMPSPSWNEGSNEEFVSFSNTGNYCLIK